MISLSGAFCPRRGGTEPARMPRFHLIDITPNFSRSSCHTYPAVARPGSSRAYSSSPWNPARTLLALKGARRISAAREYGRHSQEVGTFRRKTAWSRFLIPPRFDTGTGTRAFLIKVTFGLIVTVLPGSTIRCLRSSPADCREMLSHVAHG
jgi:hypothetical protein